MAKEVAIEKRAKISEAEQHMIIAVLCASIVLGVAISLSIHFIKQITFSADVITVQEKSIADYSKTIKNIGICVAPKGGEIYSQEELDKCEPNNITVSQVPNTLRSNIMENLAANKALNSVPKENYTECYNESKGRIYTYAELKSAYDEAAKSDNSVDLQIAEAKIKNCSALRIIPDALPAFKNVEALNASLNKLFLLSGHTPDQLGNNGSANKSDIYGSVGTMYDVISNISIDSEASTTTSVLNNIERSIRQFDINKATIEWGSATSLTFRAQAKAFYMDKSTINEKTTSMKPEDKK